jgi:hypothetical protein
VRELFRETWEWDSETWEWSFQKEKGVEREKGLMQI